jgi:hypothetical protein
MQMPMHSATGYPTESQRMHHPEESHTAQTHDEVHQIQGNRQTWQTLAGQLCAYGGVGLLTCGTVMVMWSYYGGPAGYMPTGWLIAAIGQMLLFLGVIALISGGMEQTVSEVAWRIDHLAKEVHHMGLALDELEREQRLQRFHYEQTIIGHADENRARDAA